MDYAVTDKGYKILKSTGLIQRIDAKWRSIEEQIPLGFMYDDEFEQRYKELSKDHSLNPLRRTELKKLKDSKENHDEIRKHNLIIASGKISDVILSELETAEPQRFGVSSLAELDGLIGAYCIEERFENLLSTRPKYFWRSDGFRTSIYGDTDGDLQINQKDTSGDRLFGILPWKHVNADYSYWPYLAALALKYADTIGVEIPEAKNWRNTMSSFGRSWDGDISSPYMSHGIGYEDFLLDFSEKVIAQVPDKLESKKIKKAFFGFMRPNASQDVNYLSIIDENKNLVLCSNFSDNEKTIEVEHYGQITKYRPTVIIPKSNVGHLFKGAIHGMMNNQSRTRPEFLAYMLWQHEQLKAGKTIEQIEEKGRQFDKRW